jgi:hypothetical protein
VGVGVDEAGKDELAGSVDHTIGISLQVRRESRDSSVSNADIQLFGTPLGYDFTVYNKQIKLCFQLIIIY